VSPAEVERRSILVVDDDERLRGRLARAFEDRGFEVVVAAGFEEAVERAREDSPELAVVDLRMPGHTGLDVVRELKRIDETTRIVVLTGYGSIATAVEAVKLGATHYLSKPADVDEILAAFGGPARDDVGDRSSVAREGGVGAHQPRPLRLRGQHLGSGAEARAPPAIAPAQAAEASTATLIARWRAHSQGGPPIDAGHIDSSVRPATQKCMRHSTELPLETSLPTDGRADASAKHAVRAAGSSVSGPKCSWYASWQDVSMQLQYASAGLSVAESAAAPASSWHSPAWHSSSQPAAANSAAAHDSRIRFFMVALRLRRSAELGSTRRSCPHESSTGRNARMKGRAIEHRAGVAFESAEGQPSKTADSESRSPPAPSLRARASEIESLNAMFSETLKRQAGSATLTLGRVGAPSHGVRVPRAVQRHGAARVRR
jgi:ActR/RegA family two-component response regulator